jgi:pyruvate-formate lyase-activating enzyme
MEPIRDSEILAVGDDVSGQRDVLSVLWAITKGCNFRCSYCVYNADLRTTIFSSKAQLLRGARTLERLGRPGYQITLYGGEPTMHPHFCDLLDYFVASQAPVDLRMYTNGSQNAAFFERLLVAVKDYYFGVIFSFHPDFAKFEKFKRNLEILADGGMSTGMSFMFVPGKRDEARRQIDELLELREKSPFFVSLNYPYQPDGQMGEGCGEADIAWIEASRAAFARQPVPSHLRTPFYTRIQSQVSIASRAGAKNLAPAESLQFLSRMQTPSYTGFHCCGGTNVLFVEETGTTRGGVCSASPYIGNLFTDSEIALVQAMRPVRCTAAACASIENIPLPKFRDEAAANACAAQFRARAKTYLYRAEAARLATRGAGQ